MSFATFELDFSWNTSFISDASQFDPKMLLPCLLTSLSNYIGPFMCTFFPSLVSTVRELQMDMGASVKGSTSECE